MLAGWTRTVEPPIQIRQTCLLLLDDPDNLHLGETAFPRAPAASNRQTLHHNVGVSGEQVKSRPSQTGHHSSNAGSLILDDARSLKNFWIGL